MYTFLRICQIISFFTFFFFLIQLHISEKCSLFLSISLFLSLSSFLSFHPTQPFYLPFDQKYTHATMQQTPITR
eukprot:UN10975